MMLPKMEVTVEKTADGACICVKVGDVVHKKKIVGEQAEALLKARKTAPEAT